MSQGPCNVQCGILSHTKDRLAMPACPYLYNSTCAPDCHSKGETCRMLYGLENSAWVKQAVINVAEPLDTWSSTKDTWPEATWALLTAIWIMVSAPGCIACSDAGCYPTSYMLALSPHIVHASSSPHIIHASSFATSACIPALKLWCMVWGLLCCQAEAEPNVGYYAFHVTQQRQQV